MGGQHKQMQLWGGGGRGGRLPGEMLGVVSEWRLWGVGV